MEAVRGVTVPVPSVTSMAISWAYGIGLGILGLIMYFFGIDAVETLTCGTTVGGADTGCALGPGAGSILVLVSIILMIGSAFGLVSGEGKYSLRARAREQQVLAGSLTPRLDPGGPASRPCPFCGHRNQNEFVYCQSCGKLIPAMP